MLFRNRGPAKPRSRTRLRRNIISKSGASFCGGRAGVSCARFRYDRWDSGQWVSLKCSGFSGGEIQKAARPGRARRARSIAHALPRGQSGGAHAMPPSTPRRATARPLPPGMVRARGRRSVSGGVSRSRHRIDPPAWPDPLTRARPAPHERTGARVAVVRLPMAPDAGAGPRPHRDDGRTAMTAAPPDRVMTPVAGRGGHLAHPSRSVHTAVRNARPPGIRRTVGQLARVTPLPGPERMRCVRPGVACGPQPATMMPPETGAGDPGPRWPQGTGCAGRQCQGGRRAMITSAGRWACPRSNPRSPCRSGSAPGSGTPCHRRP